MSCPKMYHKISEKQAAFHTEVAGRKIKINYNPNIKSTGTYKNFKCIYKTF